MSKLLATILDKLVNMDAEKVTFKQLLLYALCLLTAWGATYLNWSEIKVGSGYLDNVLATKSEDKTLTEKIILDNKDPTAEKLKLCQALLEYQSIEIKHYRELQTQGKSN